MNFLNFSLEFLFQRTMFKEKIYTLLGTGRGQPCVFPFENEGNWFIGCTVKGHQSWCATTLNHSRLQQWGYCTSAGEDFSCCAVFISDDYELMRAFAKIHKSHGHE
uniref:Fibronectin type-II domain-containing protein n=1 Tax=Eptatretus burgeri TaxID=7764 RepID=A0A8C4QZZ7_EPTBU